MIKTIQNYTLLQKVGQGQYGNVYKAQKKNEKGYFAVKVMSVQKFKSAPKLTQLTNNQIQILSKIDHPNIIKFIQMLQTSQHFYLIYEYCNGGTLQQLIKKCKTINQVDAVQYFKQLIQGYSVLNQKKILHRDIKPTNILFKNGVIKIADFGFCKQLMKQHEMAKSHVGSPIYMAPEVLSGELYDSKADIWSLGVVLYEMLFGKCPYQQSSIPKLVVMISSSTLHFPRYPKITQNIKLFLNKLLCSKVTQRISPIDLVNFSLDSLLVEKQQKQQIKMDYKGIIKYTRKNIQYLSQTILILVPTVNQLPNLRMTFLINKVLCNLWKNTKKKCNYWQIIKFKNQQFRWDQVYDQQLRCTQSLGEIVKQNIKKCDNSLKLKLQIEKENIDTRYFVDCIKQVSEENLVNIRDRLINCLLINIHYMRVIEKKKIDWHDYTCSNKDYKVKEEYCMKYARYNY